MTSTRWPSRSTASTKRSHPLVVAAKLPGIKQESWTTQPCRKHTTSGVKKLLMRQFARKDWTTPGPCDQGWSAVEDTLRLAGWDKSRRGVILRCAAKFGGG